MSRAWTGVVAFAVVALGGGGAVLRLLRACRTATPPTAGSRAAGTLERTLTARTRQLNTRTDALNKTAAALKRSEADVTTLESRQRALANEKAQVEDARGALELQATLAGDDSRASSATCTTGLTELLNRYAAEDFDVGRRQRRQRQRDLRAGADRLRRASSSSAADERAALGIFALVASSCSSRWRRAALGVRILAAAGRDAPPKVKTLAGRPKTLKGTPQKLAQDTLTRAAERMTLRVRNISCAGRSRPAPASRSTSTRSSPTATCSRAPRCSQLNTWDGTSIDADVDEAADRPARRHRRDQGRRRRCRRSPTSEDPKPGDKVTAVGYPLGGPLTLSPGRVIRYLDGSSCPARSPSTRKVHAALHPHQARQLRRPAARPQGPGRRRDLRRRARHHPPRTS